MPKQNQPKEEKREKGTAQAVIREILSWVIPFVIALAVAMFLKNYIIINADVPTGSMENTIMPGDRLIGNRLAYRSKSPERGDIVIFRYPDNEEELYVKRVIRFPARRPRTALRYWRIISLQTTISRLPSQRTALNRFICMPPLC